MKYSNLLALTTAALLTTGSAFAGPNCKNSTQDAEDEALYEVVARESDDKAGDDKARKDKKRKRADGDKEKPERKRRSPLRGLDLDEEQQEQAKAILSAAREQAKEIKQEAKEQKKAGEEVDREAIHEQIKALHKGAMQDVYDNVLNDEQRAKVDERRKKRAERKAKREEEGKDGERPRKKRDGKKNKNKDKGGDEDGLDL